MKPILYCVKYAGFEKEYFKIKSQAEKYVNDCLDDPNAEKDKFQILPAYPNLIF